LKGSYKAFKRAKKIVCTGEATLLGKIGARYKGKGQKYIQSWPG